MVIQPIWIEEQYRTRHYRSQENRSRYDPAVWPWLKNAAVRPWEMPTVPLAPHESAFSRALDNGMGFNPCDVVLQETHTVHIVTLDMQTPLICKALGTDSRTVPQGSSSITSSALG
jgi:hypothetical protein